MKIEWRAVTIPPFHTACEISNNGIVRTIDRIDCFGRTRKSRILSVHKTGHGYLQVLISAERKRLYALVHRLVAITFIGDPPHEGWQVNHKNGDKLDNRVENLEWVSKSENRKHAYRLGLSKGGESHPKATITEAQAIWVLTDYAKSGMRQCDYAEKLGVPRSTIHALIKGKTWKHITRPRF